MYMRLIEINFQGHSAGKNCSSKLKRLPQNCLFILPSNWYQLCSFPENLNRNLIRDSGCINQISALLWLWSGSHSVHVHALIETDSRRQPQTDQWKVWVPPLLTDVIPLNSNDDKSICVTECPRRHKLKNLEGSFILCGGQWERRERHNLLSKHWLVNNGQKW